MEPNVSVEQGTKLTDFKSVNKFFEFNLRLDAQN